MHDENIQYSVTLDTDTERVFLKAVRKILHIPENESEVDAYNYNQITERTGDICWRNADINVQYGGGRVPSTLITKVGILKVSKIKLII